MKSVINYLRSFIVKHADIHNSHSICRDAYGNIREFCKIENQTKN